MARKGPRTLPKKGPYSNASGARGGLRVFGIDKMLRNLRKESNEIYNNSIIGMYKGALLILRDATLLCPRDLQNLRASGFVMANGPKVTGKRVKRKKGSSPKFVDSRQGTTTYKPGITAQMTGDHEEVISNHEREMESRKNPMVVVGFSAFYAVYVHEDPYAHHEVGQYKFLQLSIRRNTDKVLAMIKEEARI